MPVGGRINRRDNLRSKKALTKSKVSDKNNNSKQLNVGTPGLRLLDIAKHGSTTISNVKENITKKSILDKKDIKLNEEKELLKSEGKNNDKPSTKLSSRKKTEVTPNKEASSIISNKKRIESPVKKVETLTSKEGSKMKMPEITENLYDTLKRKGRHTKKKDEEELKLPVVEKVVKVDVIENKSENVKKSRKKKDENDANALQSDIGEVVISNLISETVVETLPKRKGRSAKKKDEQESVVTSTNEVDIVKASPNKATSKLSRRNAFQKGHEHKLDIVKLVVEKMEVDDENIVQTRSTISREMKPNQDLLQLAGSNSSFDLIGEQDSGKPRVRASRIAKLVEDKKDIANESVEKEKSSDGTIQRTGSRLPKSKKPFVVENDDSIAIESKEIKIPGLVMLNNIKSRKSEISSKKQLASKNAKDNSVNKEPIELKKTPEKAVIAVKSASLKKIEKPRESIIQNENPNQEKIPGLRMTADIKKRKSELLVSSNEDPPVSIKPNVRQSISSGISQDTKSNKIPGLSTTEEIKKRKSGAIPKTAETLVYRERISIFSSAPKEEFIESTEKEMKKHVSSVIKSTNGESTSGLDSPITTLTGSLKRSSIHPPTPIPTSSDKSKEKVTSKKSKVPPMTSDKVPGLSTTSQLKKQKSDILAQKAATIDANFKLNQALEQNKQDFSDTVALKKSAEKTDNYLHLFDKETSRLDLTPKVKSATLDSSASIKFLSFKDQKPTIGILSKPSPYKRPMSSLESSDDETNSKCKISRVQVENRRQSVTFNREVEVKEIHGNSFNSITDEGGSSDDIINFEQRLRDELERTKSRVAEKRVHNLNASYSQANDFLKDKQRNIGPSMFSQQETKKTSDLSNLISTRIKIQSNSPPRETEITRSRPYEYQHQMSISSDQTKSGALKKVGPSFSSAQKEMPSNWKSFKQNPVQHNPIDEQLNDDSVSMDNEEKEDLNKSKCLIM